MQPLRPPFARRAVVALRRACGIEAANISVRAAGRRTGLDADVGSGRAKMGRPFAASRLRLVAAVACRRQRRAKVGRPRSPRPLQTSPIAACRPTVVGVRRPNGDECEEGKRRQLRAAASDKRPRPDEVGCANARVSGQASALGVADIAAQLTRPSRP